TRYRTLTDAAEVESLVDRIREQGWVSIDTQTTSLDPMRATLVGLSLALAEGEAFYLPFGHCAPGGLELEVGPAVDTLPNLPALGSDACRSLTRLLEDESVRKVGDDLKHDIVVLARAGVTLRGVWFDTMIASYVLDPGRREHTVAALAIDLLAHKTPTR